MHSDPNLQFIREKIDQLRSAVMYSMSNSLIKLPNDIVTAVKIDEEGNLWFLSHLPAQSLNECEQSFPTRLRFFRKGYDFYVEVSGKATIMKNNYYVSSPSSTFEKGGIRNKRPLLIKMTMNNVEYLEPHAKKNKTILDLVVEKTYKWMLKHLSNHHSERSVLQKLHQSH